GRDPEDALNAGVSEDSCSRRGSGWHRESQNRLQHAADRPSGVWSPPCNSCRRIAPRDTTSSPAAGILTRTAVSELLAGRFIPSSTRKVVRMSSSKRRGAGLATVVSVLLLVGVVEAQFWPQWALNPQHTGQVAVAGPALTSALAPRP